MVWYVVTYIEDTLRKRERKKERRKWSKHATRNRDGVKQSMTINLLANND
jgi:hypothetical protein